jgi:hypothetical protein
MTVCWDTAPCSLVGVNRRFRGMIVTPLPTGPTDSYISSTPSVRGSLVALMMEAVHTSEAVYRRHTALHATITSYSPPSEPEISQHKPCFQCRQANNWSTADRTQQVTRFVCRPTKERAFCREAVTALIVTNNSLISSVRQTEVSISYSQAILTTLVIQLFSSLTEYRRKGCTSVLRIT